MNQKLLNELEKLLKEDGLYNTYLDNLKLFKVSSPMVLSPCVYDNWVVFTFQNSKTVKLNNHVLEYNKSNYLVASSKLPLEGQTYFASQEEPMISMIISIDEKEIYQLIQELSEDFSDELTDTLQGTFVDSVTPEIEDLLYKLIKVIKSKEESRILGKALLKELFYRILKGKNAKFLYKLFDKSSKEAKIARTLQSIHNGFSNNLDIESLAREEDMSVASFHTHFKKITLHTPLQYIKKIRLTKARDLIIQENLQVNEVATKVGYENISHFSREFKKYFGFSPKDAKVSYAEYNLE
ncbi:AraC family transcriptional regulator [Arcobacter sp.]|uniref:AraC family transcriptional regulator n=1 Tax=unclassified Arcobacter TaxID=2593671 RepID=UPI003B007EE5